MVRQHNVVPPIENVKELTHVALAFMTSDRFNVVNQTDWSLFTTVQAVRSEFVDGTKIMIAIGGWGDSVGFEEAARNKESRLLFAKNVQAMIIATGCDGK